MSLFTDPTRSQLETRHTPGLTLTRPVEADRVPLAEMHRDPRVMATLGGVRSDADNDKAFTRWITHWVVHEFGWWIAHDRSTGKFAGRGGLKHTIVDGRGEVEVSYGFIPQFWGQGLATELALEAVRVGKEVLGLKSLVCFTLIDNLASRRVMTKVGFKEVGPMVYWDLPHVLYRLP